MLQFFFKKPFFIVQELKEELYRLLSDQKEVEIVEHAGKLAIKGNHVIRVKRWMRQLGF